MSEVGNLLARSRAAHSDYQRANRAGNKVLEKIAILQAQEHRERAHALDPSHSDDGWLDDPVSHDSILDFYSLYLQEQVNH